MNWEDLVSRSLDYNQYLQQYGSEIDRQKWQRSLDATPLEVTQVATLSQFRRRLTLLCMAGAWCGDCVEHVPILRQFELQCPTVRLCLIDRDANAELKNYLTICGSPRVPQTVVLSEDYLFVDRWGDRPLARYLDMAARLEGAACSSGIISADDPLRQAVIQNWLDELHRCQLILRTSPSLRQRYGD